MDLSVLEWLFIEPSFLWQAATNVGTMIPEYKTVQSQTAQPVTTALHCNMEYNPVKGCSEYRYVIFIT